MTPEQVIPDDKLEGENPPTDEPALEEVPIVTSPRDDERENWEEPSQELPEGEGQIPEGGVQVGLSPLGPLLVVTAPDGTTAQKVVSVEECFLLAGQLLGLGNFVMQMGMQAQMQEQARLSQMMAQEEKTKSGLYVKRN